MSFRTYGLFFACLLAVALTTLGCNNTLNPLCGSARPAPMIGSLSPSTLTFAQVQDGPVLAVNGSSFVAASVVVINSTPLATTVVNAQQLQVKLSADVISGPGTEAVMVQTPSGNSGDLGCTSGGKSSVLNLTVN
jgi:hypothetical protein